MAVAAADSKWKELPALNSADAGCIADADEFGYVQVTRQVDY